MTDAALVQELTTALLPFVEFLHWIEAAADSGAIDPLTDHTCIASLSAGGGSNYLWLADLRRARTALTKVSAEGIKRLI